MIRTLIADDSAAVRALLVSILERDPDIKIVGEAHTGTEAVRLTERLRPDVITMDIHMPELDGLQATKAIMGTCPTPIVIVSSVVQKHDATMSLEATRVGALTAVPKPDNPQATTFAEDAAQLVAMVKAMSQVKVVRRWGNNASALGGRKTTGSFAAVQQQPSTRPISIGGTAPAERGRTSTTSHAHAYAVEILAIAASTGGPAALEQVLSGIRNDLHVPVLVVQHMAKGFMPALASWLSNACRLTVEVAQLGDVLRPGHVYIAPDDWHLGVTSDHRIVLAADPPIGGFRPAATHLFQSVARVYGRHAVGVILTGMGRDGVDGLKTLHEAGGWIIAQDEASSVVYGMPQEAVRAGVVDAVAPLGDVPRAITERSLFGSA